jgi:hypothetical protein
MAVHAAAVWQAARSAPCGQIRRRRRGGEILFGHEGYEGHKAAEMTQREAPSAKECRRFEDDAAAPQISL